MAEPSFCAPKIATGSGSVTVANAQSHDRPDSANDRSQDGNTIGHRRHITANFGSGSEAYRQSFRITASPSLTSMSPTSCPFTVTLHRERPYLSAPLQRSFAGRSRMARSRSRAA